MPNSEPQTHIEWIAHEFQHREKGPGWYLTLAILTILIVGYEVIQKDWFAALTLLVAAIVIAYVGSLYPDEILVRITDEGVHFGDNYVPFHNVRRFWIVSHDKAHELHIETTAYLNRLVIIQLADQDYRSIRTVLRQYLPETQPNYEKISHRIGRRLRF